MLRGRKLCVAEVRTSKGLDLNAAMNVALQSLGSKSDITAVEIALTSLRRFVWVARESR